MTKKDSNQKGSKIRFKKATTPFTSPWPAIWVWFFLAIVSLSIIAPGNLLTTTIKLSSILACLVYSLKVFPKDHLLNLALFFTFVADILLTISTSQSEPIVFFGQLGMMELGVMVFFCTQICHLFRLTQKNLNQNSNNYRQDPHSGRSHNENLTKLKFGNLKSRTLILALGLFMIVTTLINLILNFAPLMIEICVFYVVALIANIIVSLLWVRRKPRNLVAKFALIGFSLFLCCDLCTGISYLATNGTFPNNLIGPANFFAWFFYYPSQIFISNSSKYVKIEPKQEIVL